MLSQMSPVQAIQFFFKIHFNIVLLFTHRSSRWSRFLTFSPPHLCIYFPSLSLSNVLHALPISLFISIKKLLMCYIYSSRECETTMIWKGSYEQYKNISAKLSWIERFQFPSPSSVVSQSGPSIIAFSVSRHLKIDSPFCIHRIHQHDIDGLNG